MSTCIKMQNLMHLYCVLIFLQYCILIQMVIHKENIQQKDVVKYSIHRQYSINVRQIFGTFWNTESASFDSFNCRQNNNKSLTPYPTVKLQGSVTTLKFYRQNASLVLLYSDSFTCNNTKPTFRVINIRILSIASSNFSFTLKVFVPCYTAIA